MRILNAITSASLEGGGPIEATLKQGMILTKAGHCVELVTLDVPSDSWVQQCPLKVHALGPAKSKYGFSDKFLPWLQQNTSYYDCVVVQGMWQYPGYGVWKALKNSRTPYVVVPHGMLDPWFRKAYPLKHLKKWLYWPWAEYRVLRDAKAVLFTCEEEKLLARKSFWLYQCNEKVVNLGTQAPENFDHRNIAILERYPELTGKRILLYLSRLHPKKGCDMLIEAFAQVASSNPSLHLVMAGPDPVGFQEELKQIVQKHRLECQVTFTGMLKGVEKESVLQSADVFILPSHQETFPISILEALSFSCPVLITPRINIWREIEQDGAGIVADDTLTGTISLLERWLALSESDKQVMRENAKRSFADRFEIHQAVQSLLDVLQQ